MGEMGLDYHWMEILKVQIMCLEGKLSGQAIDVNRDSQP